MTSLKDKKILVVDDDPAKNAAVAGGLENAGFTVITAEDGEVGLATALKEKPDLIMLDIQMPKMDGLEMLTELRKDDYGKNVPVVLLTAINDPDKVADALKLNASNYLLKDVYDLDDVLKIVKEKLGV